MGPGTPSQRLFANSAVVWVALAAAGAAIHLLLWQYSEPQEIFSDFYKAYYPAGQSVVERGPVAPWTTDEGAAYSFVNLPILAWLFAPFARLDEVTAGQRFLAVGIPCALASYALLARLARLDMGGGALLLFIFLVNGPMVNSLREGNTTHILLLLLVVALLLWRAGFEYSAGLVLGFCAVFKLPLLLYGAYFLLRRRWRIVTGGATSIVVLAALSLWYFGLAINIAWYSYCVEPFLTGVIPAFNVQSVDGFLVRLVTGASLLQDWTPIPSPAFYAIPRTIAFVAIYGGIFWLIWRSGRHEPLPRIAGALSARDFNEYALVLVLAFVTSPISWTHYYLLMLLPWSLYQGSLLPLPDDRPTRILMWGGLALISLPVLMPELTPGWKAEIIARTIVSMWLYGGLLMLVALLRGAWRTAQPAPDARPAANP